MPDLKLFTQLIHEKLAEAKEMFGFDKHVNIRYDIKGRKSGQAILRGGQYTLRFNPEAIEKYWATMSGNTIPHEVAHLVCFWNRNLGDGHDAGWQAVAISLGCDGSRLHTMQLTPGRPAPALEYAYTATDGKVVHIKAAHHEALQSGRAEYLRYTGKGVRVYAKDFISKAIAGQEAITYDGSNNAATTNHNENDIMTTTNALTATAKTWIKTEAKDLKINPVGKSMETILGLIAEKTGRTTEMTLFLANGGSVKELPGFEGIKPLPNRKETSAGGKTEKRTPRKLTKSDTKTEVKAGKETTSDTVTLASILEELGIEGRIARRKLRNSDITKPGASWEWTKGHADITKVKELLTK